MFLINEQTFPIRYSPPSPNPIKTLQMYLPTVVPYNCDHTNFVREEKRDLLVFEHCLVDVSKLLGILTLAHSLTMVNFPHLTLGAS